MLACVSHKIKRNPYLFSGELTALWYTERTYFQDQPEQYNICVVFYQSFYRDFYLGRQKQLWSALDRFNIMHFISQLSLYMYTVAQL